MRHKVFVLTVLVTMAHWLGCAGGGGEQNYRMLGDDPPLFPQDDGPQSRAPGWIGTAMAQDAAEPAHAAEFEDGLNDATAPGEAMPADDAAAAPDGWRPPVVRPGPEAIPLRVSPLSETEPSIGGLDRSHWPRMVIRPARGRVRHHPIYFEDFDLPTTATAGAATAAGRAGAGGVAAVGTPGTALGVDSPLAGVEQAPRSDSAFDQTGIARSGVVTDPGDPGRITEPDQIGEPTVTGEALDPAALPEEDGGVGEALAPGLDAAGADAALDGAGTTAGLGTRGLISTRTGLREGDPLLAALTVEDQLEAALSAHPPQRYAAGHAKALVLQPLKFAADLVLLPVRAVVRPPWSEVTTPEVQGR